MAAISGVRVRRLLTEGDSAPTARTRGDALEEVICYIFERIPGITITRRNALNASGSQEIDIAFWNERRSGGLYFFPFIILVECKNTQDPVESKDVAAFDNKLQQRARKAGILVAANGITGSPEERTAAQQILTHALSQGREIVVLDREEIEGLSDTTQLVRLIQEKLCELTVRGSIA